jgi:hypothetical protein
MAEFSLTTDDDKEAGMNSKPKNTQDLTAEADQDTKLQRDLSIEPPPSCEVSIGCSSDRELGS